MENVFCDVGCILQILASIEAPQWNTGQGWHKWISAVCLKLKWLKIGIHDCVFIKYNHKKENNLTSNETDDFLEKDIFSLLSALLAEIELS